jgi:histidinol-phosphatase (PHP family)
MSEVTGNYHTHTQYDDGQGELAEYVAAAKDRGFRYLGFSGHAPMDLPSDWLMSRANLARYLSDYRALSDGDTGVRLFLGLEVDYLPGYSLPTRAVWPGLDYVIGSVHYVVSPRRGEPGWTVDGPAAELDLGLDVDFGGDMRALVEAYYGCVARMVSESPPDIVAHFDLIKKNNRDGRRFDEAASWYRKAALDALDALAVSGCVAEVNTGALNRGTLDTVYPSPWLLQEFRRRGIRMAVSSDAHRSEHLDGHFDRALRELADAGYRTRVELTEDGWAERGM